MVACLLVLVRPSVRRSVGRSVVWLCGCCVLVDGCWLCVAGCGLLRVAAGCCGLLCVVVFCVLCFSSGNKFFVRGGCLDFARATKNKLDKVEESIIYVFMEH